MSSDVLSQQSPQALHHFNSQSSSKSNFLRKSSSGLLFQAGIHSQYGHSRNDSLSVKLTPKYPASDSSYSLSSLLSKRSSSAAFLQIATFFFCSKPRALCFHLVSIPLFWHLNGRKRRHTSVCSIHCFPESVHKSMDSNKNILEVSWMSFQSTCRVFSHMTSIYLNCFTTASQNRHNMASVSSEHAGIHITTCLHFSIMVLQCSATAQTYLWAAYHFLLPAFLMLSGILLQ